MKTEILVVEDDPDNGETLALVFTAWGFTVRLAATGERALGLAAARRPNVVVLDLGLPGIQGEDVVRVLKGGASPPFVIAYSGFDRLEEAALAAGCDAFVVKPSLEALARLLVSVDLSQSAQGAS